MLRSLIFGPTGLSMSKMSTEEKVLAVPVDIDLKEGIFRAEICEEIGERLLAIEVGFFVIGLITEGTMNSGVL